MTRDRVGHVQLDQRRNLVTLVIAVLVIAVLLGAADLIMSGMKWLLILAVALLMQRHVTASSIGGGGGPVGRGVPGRR